jgi:hypothetical protein
MEITKEQFNKLPNPLKLYFELKTENVPRLNVAYERRCDNNFGGGKDKRQGTITGEISLGRFPANLIHDNSEEVRECFPDTKSGAMNGTYKNTMMKGVPGVRDGKEIHLYQEASSGNASRFFKSIIYTAKASKSERNKGCEGLEDKVFYEMDNGHGNLGHFMVKKAGGEMGDTQMRKNNHPTVKPIALMEYLIKMVTKPGGIVLDPFAGSGSTLVAAKENGFNYIGIEMIEEYIPIIEARLKVFQNTLL